MTERLSEAEIRREALIRALDERRVGLDKAVGDKKDYLATLVPRCEAWVSHQMQLSQLEGALSEYATVMRLVERYL